MPNIWTHFLFARDLARRINWHDFEQTPDLHRTFRFGSQGPDFLFYHRFFPWQRSQRMPELGSAMHQTKCGPFLLDLIDSVRGKPLHHPETVYVLGFLTHHLLDRHAHPYVFYRSGFRKWDHQRLEIWMDTLVARQLLQIETWKTPVWKEIDLGSRLPGQIADTLQSIAKRHYPEQAAHLTPEHWNAAYRDMIRAQRLFHDPSGWKRRLTFGQIEPLVFKQHVPPHDYLNETHQVWLHPSDPDEQSTQSFWDLWEQAMEDGIVVLSAAIAYICCAPADVSAYRARLEQSIGNRSYETGKDCALGLQIVHVDPMILV